MNSPWLVVFDFDWSLINENSDTFIFECLDMSGELLREVKAFMQQPGASWTTCMDTYVGKLMSGSYGVTKAQLIQCLHSIPYFTEMFAALKLVKEAGCEIVVLSDANEVYITEILTAYELNDYVDSVITNKGYWEDGHDGTPILRIKPYHHNSSCSLCPENLCKGSVLSTLLQVDREHENKRRVMYIGDGEGDFCSITRMKKGDVVFCREGYSLQKKIKKYLEKQSHDNVQTFTNPTPSPGTDSITHTHDDMTCGNREDDSVRISCESIIAWKNGQDVLQGFRRHLGLVEQNEQDHPGQL